MCGILGSAHPDIAIALQSLAHRGPDASGIMTKGCWTFGHTRLAILDLDVRSNQPFVYGTTLLVYNGELWNYQVLRTELELLGCSFQTQGDTEVVAAALDYWGAEALVRFNGMFALAWTSDGQTLYLARDRYGEIPLHIATQRPFCFASEVKALQALRVHAKSIQMLAPGVVATVTPQRWQVHPYIHESLAPIAVSRKQAASTLQTFLADGCHARAIADVPVCTLLSGGLDSAAVAWGLLQRLPHLVAYTAVHNPRSRDLHCARLCARALGIALREVYVPLPTPEDLIEVIYHIEMPHKAQIEIGWACLCLARQMQRDGMKVTFSGEGSDELWASYGFAYHALQHEDWHRYRHHLFLEQHRKNFARCNKIFMAHGVECRLPFLHPPLAAYAFRLPRSVVQDGKGRPKAVLQEAFASALPREIVGRPKVAFQDGLGLKQAIAQSLSRPERFYHAEYTRNFTGVSSH